MAAEPDRQRLPAGAMPAQLNQAHRGTQIRAISAALQRRVARKETDQGHPSPIGTVQRVTETDTDYKDFATLSGYTVQEFEDYVQTQADWHVSPDLNEAQLDKLRDLLAFVREPNMMQTCGGMEVDALSQTDDEGRDHIRALAPYLVAQEPIAMGRPGHPRVGVKRGVALPKLVSEFGAPSLAEMKDETLDQVARSFETATPWTDALIHYHRSASQTPYFEADPDFSSYVKMREKCKVDPLSYDGGTLEGNVRNYHRFLKKSLDTLQTNFGNTSKAKPVTLILHSAVDYNGAFHRSTGLDKVIADPHHLGLMVEGGESLGQYTGWVKAIAAKYGIGGKLDQVLFSGHGGMRSVEMAGTPTAKDSVDLDDNKEETDKLFAAVLDAIDPGFGIDHAPLNIQRRIVFNACLTNTNYVPVSKIPQSEEVEDINQAVREYLAKTPTLKGYLDQLITEKGVKATSEGANAVTRASGLIDEGTGRLGLSSDDDTYLVADKLEYVRFGKEPIGVLRAAVECITWTDKSVVKACYKDMTARVQGSHTDWRDAFVAASFALVLKQAPKDHAWLLSYLSSQSGAVEDQIHPDKFSSMGGMIGLKKMSEPFFALLKGSSLWKSRTFAVNILQAWMLAVPDNLVVQGELLTNMAELQCNTLRRMIAVGKLKEANLMEPLLASGDAGGRLRLALLGVLSEEVDAHAKNYLLTLLGEDQVFNPTLGIPTALNGISTWQRVQTLIGKPPPEVDVVVPEELANVTLAGDDRNTVKVHSITRKGRISKDPSTNVYTGPATDTAVLGTLNQNELCWVFGETPLFYGVERKRAVQQTLTLYVSYFDLQGSGEEDTDTVAGAIDAYESLENLTEFEKPIALAEETEVNVLARGLGEDKDVVQISVQHTSNVFSSGFVLKTDMALL